MSKYSIILPVRNGGEYIKQCVRSVLAQTYSDFNFIILDNNSTDGTLQWLQHLTDKRIQLHTSPTDLTIEQSWDRITQIEKNEFITLIGHDDLLLTNFLEEIDKLISANPDAGLYHTHFNFIDSSSKVIRNSKPMPASYSAPEFLKAFLTQSVDSMGTGYVMRSKDYDILQGIPVRYPSLLFADFELWLNLIGNRSMMVSPKNCFAFRVHQSTTGTSSDEKLQKAFGLFIDHLAALAAKDAALNAVIKENGVCFLLFYGKGLANRLLRTPLEKRNGLTVKAYIVQTKEYAKKIGVDTMYQPQKLFAIRLAIFIDSYRFTRSLFLLFKKVYAQPLSTT